MYRYRCHLKAFFDLEGSSLHIHTPQRGLRLLIVETLSGTLWQDDIPKAVPIVIWIKPPSTSVLMKALTVLRGTACPTHRSLWTWQRYKICAGYKRLAGSCQLCESGNGIQRLDKTRTASIWTLGSQVVRFPDPVNLHTTPYSPTITNSWFHNVQRSN